MRILIVRLDHLGDVILTTPLVRSAVKAGHQVHVLVRESCSAVFAGDSAVTTHAIEQVAPHFPSAWPTLARWMRAQSFDTILLPYAKPPQLLLASAFSGAKQRIAMWGGLLGRLTLHRCLRSGIQDGDRHFSDILLDCARAAGFPIDGLKPDFILTPAELAPARAWLDTRFPGLKIVGIHPGCAGNTCNPPPALYGALAARLLDHPSIAIIGTGIAAERRLFEAWPAAVLSHPRFHNACGQWTLRELAAHIAHYSAMVIPSTGPLHIASAFSIPTLSPFCCYRPISATVWGSQALGSIVLSPPEAFCAERRVVSASRNCDFQGTIPVDTFYNNLLAILGLTAPGAPAATP
jgi:ADP-heptose:LPS heptosyltransferase